MVPRRPAGGSDGRTVQPVDAGCVIVRVPRRAPDGRSRDNHDAYETLRGQPWFADVKYLGCDQRYHLFQRPKGVL